jgi:hypothetical protein
MALSGAVSTNVQVFAKPAKSEDPCKAFKELAKYVEGIGLIAVGTGDDDMMSELVKDFELYSEIILEVSPPEKGKC